MSLFSPKPAVRAPHRFTIEEYQRMANDGYFSGQRVEFIDGEIIDLPPQKNPHTYVVTVGTAALHRMFDIRRYWVRVQSTLKVAGSMPEPDFAVVDGPPQPKGDYPTGALLVIEIADTTLAEDLGTKANLYAAGGIADYWVINIPDRTFVIHRQPVVDGQARFGWRYADVQSVAPGNSLAPLAMPNDSIDPADWLP